MSTTELNISPLPWYDDGYRVHAATEDTDMRNGRVIFEYKHVDEPNDADYPFIVRAVNSHADMLEALEAALEEVAVAAVGHTHVERGMAACPASCVRCRIERTHSKIAEAIAKAKGGAA